MRLVASGDGAEGSLRIHQGARLYAGLFDGNETARHALHEGRLGYVQVARGSIELNGRRLNAGDGAMLRNEPEIELREGNAAEVLVFDLPSS